MSKKIRLGYDILSKRAIETESGVNIDDALRSISSYQKVTGVGIDNHPDVPRPSTKVIYIVKVAGAGQPDTYKEWIWNQPADGLGAWECIGDTSMDLSDMAKKSEMSVESVQGDPTKNTIQLKSGLAQEVVIEHQDISGKQDTLTFGYNASSQITSIDSHDLAPSVDSTVYLANYTSTAGTAIKDALNAGKTVICRNGSNPSNPTFGLIGAYDKSSNRYQFNFISKTTNTYGQDKGDISFGMVVCNGAGTSWFGQYSPLTFKAPTATGQIMKSVSAANGQFDWSLATVRETPASTAADENKVLTVDNTGTPQWYGPITSDIFGSQLLDENDSPVLDTDNKPVFDSAAASNLWTSFANQEFGARRTYEDQDGQNIKATYATKQELQDALGDLETILASI